MSKTGLTEVARSVQTAVKKHSPEILTGIGIAGMLTTTVLAVRATPRAVKLIEEEKRKQNRELVQEAMANGEKDCQQIDKLKPIEVVRLTWKCYIPSALVGTVSILCLIGASSVNFRRNAALATAYTLSESALKEYQEKVIEEVGEKKEQQIRDSIAKDRVQKDPFVNKEVVFTNKGNTLCYETLSKKYFRSDINQIKKTVNDLNRDMRNENAISFNDFLYELGLDGEPFGDEIGWNIDKGYIDLYFSSQLAEDDTPCLVIDYNRRPEYGYDN